MTAKIDPKTKRPMLTRTEAGELIDKVRLLATEAVHSNQPPFEERLKALLASYELPEPKPCTGEAHHGPGAGYIDNCGVCMPHWGTVYRETWVR